MYLHCAMEFMPLHDKKQSNKQLCKAANTMTDLFYHVVAAHQSRPEMMAYTAIFTKSQCQQELCVVVWKYHRKHEFGKICEVLIFAITSVFLVLLLPVFLGCRREKAHGAVLWTHLQRGSVRIHGPPCSSGERRFGTAEDTLPCPVLPS